MTPGHRFETALACQSKQEASWWFVKSIGEITKQKSISFTMAANQVAFFLGFMAGYYNDPETSARIKDLFGMDSSVFGSPTEKIDDHRRRKARRGK